MLALALAQGRCATLLAQTSADWRSLVQIGCEIFVALALTSLKRRSNHRRIGTFNLIIDPQATAL
jgi:hypothetical protein